MSPVLELAGRLRSLSDEELVRLLRLRGGTTKKLKDFFDLAEWLLQPRNLETLVNSLSRSALEFASGAGGASDNPLLVFLRDHSLVHFSPSSIGFSQTAPGKRADDGIAGIHAFECLAAITELIFELEHNELSDTGKQGLASSEAKRIAPLIGKEPDFVKSNFELARASGLVTSIDSRWVLTDRASWWLDVEPEERWSLLAKTWLELLGFIAADELASQLSGGAGLASTLRLCFPLERFEPESRLGHVITYSELIGLSVADELSSWTIPLVEGNLDKAAKLIAASLPQTQSRVIVQSDLSIIAPGPLTAVDERELRVFVDIEQAGLASRYRLSALSVSFGLESGLSAAAMTATLQRLSDKPLPQPVEYLLAEAEKRFGRIRVIEDPRTGGCFVSSTDEVLLTELATEVRLKPYALVRQDRNLLASKLNRDRVYFGLRNIGHIAIRTDKDGKLLPPIRFVATASVEAETGDWAQTVARLRENDRALSESSDDEAMLQQIMLAIKLKSKIQVSYLGQDGTEVSLTLEPNGVANGRVRGRDRKADIERTLPLANITSVSFL